MAIDAAALEEMRTGISDTPLLRFFQWSKPTITYGYLLDPEKVKQWSRSMDHSLWTIDCVKRPTGGGAVLHTPSDLSLSLLWPRASRMFSDTPRLCYEQIHTIIVDTLNKFLKKNMTLKQKDTAPSCATNERFSACFQAPVCNDVMEGGKKIVGGALRITREAILYQGTIQYGK